MRDIYEDISKRTALCREPLLVIVRPVLMLFHGKWISRFFIGACFLLFILLGKNSACASDILGGYPYKGSYTERVDYLFDLLDSLHRNEEPANIAMHLDRLEVKAREENDRELEYGFRLLKYKQRRDTRGFHMDSALEQELTTLINEIDREDYVFLKIFAMDILSDYYWNLKEYGPSIELELQAYNLFRDIPTGIYPGKFGNLYDLAGKFYHFRDYDNAKKLLLEASKLQPRHDFPSYVVVLNLLGMCYRHQGIYDSAEYYFKEAYKEAADGDVYQGIASGNLGITYYHQQRYEEAIPLLEKDIEYCMKLNETSNATISMAILSDIYLRKKETEKALALANRAHDLIKKEGFWNNYLILDAIYPVLAKIHAARGDHALAYAYADSSLRARENLTKQKSALILAGAQNVVAAQQHMTELQQLENQKRLEVQMRNSLLVGIILLATVALLVINRRKIMYRRRQEKLELEKSLLDADLANAEIQLAQFTKSILEKNELIEKFTAGLEGAPSFNNGTGADLRTENLMQLQASTILTDEQWEDFRKLFEKVHGGYLERLKQKISGLSPAETRFLALSKLRLSNKEMAGMLGIGTDAVRMSKHRLRKRLNLPDEATIEELVETL